MEFTDLPPSKKHAGSQKWRDAVAAAKQRPNDWLMVGNYSPGVASQIRAGMYPAFYPQGTDNARTYIRVYWQITTRTTTDRRCDVYIRWLGEKE